MTDTASLYTNQPVRTRKNNLPVVIGAVIAIVVLVGGFIMFRQSKKTVPPKVAVVEKKEPSPTEMPKIDKSTVKIQVQNGTGTPGQAGTAVDALKKAGYNSDNIQTANAKDFTSTVTTITARAGFEGTANDIKTSLSGAFTDINIDPAKLDTTSAFDIVIVTGGKIFEEATPTASAISPTNTSASPTVIPTTTPTSTLTPTSSPTPTP